MSSVDIVVPCYRYGCFLRECVESVLSQEGVDARVLIIDDASPDDTPEVAAELYNKSSKVTFVRHSANKGHIATYNEGIDWASADYCMILSADDYLLPGALNRAVTLMEAHPEVGFTYGRVVTLDQRGSVSSVSMDTEATGWQVMTGLAFIELSGARNIVPTPTAIVRTQLQKRVGGYRPELPHSGDLEMWLRLAAHGSVGVTEAYQAAYRRHAGNMSLRYMADRWYPDLQQRKAAFNYFLEDCANVLPHPGHIRQRFSKLLAQDALDFANGAFNDGDSSSFDKLYNFALQEYPAITWSSTWMKLLVKRTLGIPRWQTLQPCIARHRVTSCQ